MMNEEIKKILSELGEDIHREGLIKTPERMAKSLQFLTQGGNESLETILDGATFESDHREMVALKEIEFYSLCEHHLLPFFGKCHIAYLPHGKLLGLSRINRIINFHTRHLQVQENLTQQIAETLLKATNARGLAVVMEAQHLCVSMLENSKQNALMTTSVMLGEFQDNVAMRADFLVTCHSKCS
jgi:GTP cyclohydrolase I